MAEDNKTSRLPLTHSRLAALQALTQAIGEAVLEADLDRAAALLEQRQATLQHLDWQTAGNDQFHRELQALWALEAKLLDFCRTWQKILLGQLQQVNSGLYLRQCYSPSPSESRFVDLHK